MEDSKYCINCGKKIEGNAQFCPYCGAQQGSKPTDTTPSSEISTPTPDVVTPVSEEPIAESQHDSETSQATSSADSTNTSQSESATNNQQATFTQNATGAQKNIVDKIVEATKDTIQKTAVLEGRLSLADYWYGALGLMILGLLAYVILLIIPIIGILLLIAINVPYFTMSFRRLHDVNRPSVHFLFFLIPFVGVVLEIMWFIQPGTDGPNNFGPKPVEVTK